MENGVSELVNRFRVVAAADHSRFPYQEGQESADKHGGGQERRSLNL